MFAKLSRVWYFNYRLNEAESIKFIKGMLISDLTCFPRSAWVLLVSCQQPTFTFPEYWPMIGREWSHDLDTGLWLVSSPHLHSYCALDGSAPKHCSFSLKPYRDGMWWLEAWTKLRCLSLMVWLMAQKRIDKIHHHRRHLGLDTGSLCPLVPGSLAGWPSPRYWGCSQVPGQVHSWRNFRV